MQILKYRPVLTSTQIAHVITLCKKDLSGESLSVISTLAPFMAKIENKGINPAYKVENKNSLNDFESLEYQDDGRINYEAMRFKVYKKWIDNPESCNGEELAKVQDYRAGNGLMSPEEQKDYETKFNELMEITMQGL
jgi:hypothetical protein